MPWASQLKRLRLPFREVQGQLRCSLLRCRPADKHRAPDSLRSTGTNFAYTGSHRTPTTHATSTERSGLVLGIESSCDDTGAAVLSSVNGRVFGEALFSQADIHAPWGGVVPNLAMEAHKSAMDKAVEQALSTAGVTADQLEAVAVTQGPGLGMCLKVGVKKALQLAAQHQVPFIGVHHLEAHALMARQAQDIAFPFLCLLVSGGHCLLLVVHGVGNYTLLGSSLDDAVGEAFDKAARMLNLDARPSGGAAIEALALQGDAHAVRFPVPLAKRKDCNFSFAGLKTSVLHAVTGAAFGEACEANLQVRANIAASFQRVVVQHLSDRCRRAAGWACEAWPGISALVVSGGVACNLSVRTALQQVADEAQLQLVLPPPRLCTDNGIMVAWAGVERLRMGLWEPPPAHVLPEDAMVDVRPRWPLTHRLDQRSLPEKRTMKKKRLHVSLTELTQLQMGISGKLDAPDRVLD